MNNINNTFSIVDLENLSGIKQHTIRIWEKRYHLFQPERHGNNERLYQLHDLQKLLNVLYLQENGWKISKIAQLSDALLKEKVKELIPLKGGNTQAIHQFLVSMFSFDQSLFQNTYHNLLQELSFREIFWEVFIPLLEHIGLLWQNDTIVPAHEHFISQLIENKLHVSIEKLQTNVHNPSKYFVLFLPENEIHNIGLLYMQYELLLKGYYTIYLGNSVPIENLKKISELYSPIVFITYFTVAPHTEHINFYLQQIEKELLNDSENECWINGKKSSLIPQNILPNNIRVFSSVKEMLKLI